MHFQIMQDALRWLVPSRCTAVANVNANWQLHVALACLESGAVVSVAGDVGRAAYPIVDVLALSGSVRAALHAGFDAEVIVA